MSEVQKKYGIPIEVLQNIDPCTTTRIISHFSELPDVIQYTLGQLGHLDVVYGQADPRVEAVNKTFGDFTATGGTGPNKS